MQLSKAITDAYTEFKNTDNIAWNFGDTWKSNYSGQFDTYFSQHLFPKLNKTEFAGKALGNRFQRFLKTEEDRGQFIEEYVILDTIPSHLDIDKDAEELLHANYPKLATKFYHRGDNKKVKYTINNKATRYNFATVGDAAKHALEVTQKRYSDLNITEEAEVKAMLVDYAMNHTNEVRQVTDIQDMAKQMIKAILNMQNNSYSYNEATEVSGGRYTTTTKLDDIVILTTDELKTELLSEVLAHAFHAQGIDLTNKIISFEDLGGVYRLKKTIQLTAEQAKLLNSYGEYTQHTGDTILAGTVFTFNILEGNVFDSNDFEEIKPDSELFAFILDENAIRYKKYGNDDFAATFYNPETLDYTYYIHLNTSKAVSPFYNKILLKGK